MLYSTFIETLHRANPSLVPAWRTHRVGLPGKREPSSLTTHEFLSIPGANPGYMIEARFSGSPEWTAGQSRITSARVVCVTKIDASPFGHSHWREWIQRRFIIDDPVGTVRLVRDLPALVDLWWQLRLGAREIIATLRRHANKLFTASELLLHILAELREKGWWDPRMVGDALVEILDKYEGHRATLLADLASLEAVLDWCWRHPYPICEIDFEAGAELWNAWTTA